jgi:hypothetical protein
VRAFVLTQENTLSFSLLWYSMTSHIRFVLIQIPILKPFQWGNKYTPLAVVSRARKTLINHCYDRANSGCFVERGRCTQHAKIPSGSSLTSDTYECRINEIANKLKQ